MISKFNLQASEFDTGTIEEEQEISLENEDPDEEALSPVSEETIENAMEKCDIKEEETDNGEKDSPPRGEIIVDGETHETKDNVVKDETEENNDNANAIIENTLEENKNEKCKEEDLVKQIEGEVENTTEQTQEDDEDDEDFEYPDTNIELQYMGGEVYVFFHFFVCLFCKGLFNIVISALMCSVKIFGQGLQFFLKLDFALG